MDSGCIQEEKAFLGVLCLTIRKNTERPIEMTKGCIPLLSDGRAAQRIADVIAEVGGRLIFDGGFRHDDLMLESSRV